MGESATAVGGVVVSALAVPAGLPVLCGAWVSFEEGGGVDSMGGACIGGALGVCSEESGGEGASWAIRVSAEGGVFIVVVCWEEHPTLQKIAMLIRRDAWVLMDPF
ncbi:MAG: hypothetical protein QXI19_11055 [Candidatus Caldarchaeum sp.]